jgi:Putative prokaryotic signal transducing protein
MIELVRTNDAVVISFIESLLRDAGIDFFVADQNMSVLDGSIGVLPRRIMVAKDDVDAARRLLTDAGFAKEIRRDRP